MGRTTCRTCNAEISNLNRIGLCKDCRCDYESRRNKAKYLEQKYWGKEVRLYGRFQVKDKPNHYCDDQQREEVFNILTLLGWKFNEENGIWFDGKIKDENGNWYNVR